MIIPLGRPLPTGSSHPPARSGGRPVRLGAASRAYMMLLRMGFGLPRLSPAARWAFTPPFHPYLDQLAPAGAVCFLCHCPSPSAAVWGKPHQHALSRLAVSQHPARWSPDFPPRFASAIIRPAPGSNVPPARIRHMLPPPQHINHSQYGAISPLTLSACLPLRHDTGCCQASCGGQALRLPAAGSRSSPLPRQRPLQGRSSVWRVSYTPGSTLAGPNP